jgi:hypothetical protein
VWLSPDAVQRLSPWLRWSVAAIVGACTTFMLVHNYPWLLLLYIDTVFFGFAWAVLFHIAADRNRTTTDRVPSQLISGCELGAGHVPPNGRQLTIRGWQLFGASLLLGVVGMGVLIMLFART